MEIVIALFVALLGIFGYKIANKRRPDPDRLPDEIEASPIARDLDRSERESRDTDDRIDAMRARAEEVEAVDTSRGADPDTVDGLRSLRDSGD